MANQNPMKILMVEDEIASRFVLRRILESAGDLEVHEAEDGQSAWDLLEGGLAAQLCFLDINMPRLNGLELLRGIRSDPRMAGIKVCFCSAVHDPRILRQAAALRPDYYVLKPYSKAVILAQLQKAREASRPSPDSATALCARLGIDEAGFRPQPAARSPAPGRSDFLWPTKPR